MLEEDIKVIENMEKYGGSFVKALANCFWRADSNNFVKLQITFIDYWNTYKNFNKS